MLIFLERFFDGPTIAHPLISLRNSTLNIHNIFSVVALKQFIVRYFKKTISLSLGESRNDAENVTQSSLRFYEAVFQLCAA